MKRILFSPNSEGGGSQGSPGPIGPPSEPTAPPPAAQTVLDGVKTERELELEKKLKDREIELAHIQDENHRLKQIPTRQPASSAPEDKDDWTAFKS